MKGCFVLTACLGGEVGRGVRGADNLDARLLERLETASLNLGVRVFGRRHDAANACFHDGFGARRRAAFEAAGLEADVERPAASCFAGLL